MTGDQSFVETRFFSSGGFLSASLVACIILVILTLAGLDWGFSLFGTFQEVQEVDRKV